MTALEIAGLQTDIVWESPRQTFHLVRPMIERATASGARLVVLPEMFATGFSMDAETVAPHGETVRDFLAETAKRSGVWLAGGYAEAGSGGSKPKNACSIFAPDGEEALRYHKIHPFSLAGEHLHFAGGTELPSVTIEGVRVTPLICYDLRFPEPFRIAAERTDLFLVVANWPDARIDAWSTLLKARAIENQAFVLGVNRVGEGDGLAYSGRSALVDPSGYEVATAAHQPAVLRASVAPAAVRAHRERFSFLADRRPDVYGAMP
ncbi:MAG: carbon-nitrogen family hydrolase [Acidobacteria bacterium]|nr:carbon-nitrogen family hydrolase [Acidobacteriota bacterium]